MKTNSFWSGILTRNRGQGTRTLFAGTLLVATALLFSCSTIATYDQVAYEHATNAKVDTLALMDKATDTYSSRVKEVDLLRLSLQKAYEYDKGRPLDQVTIALWEKLLDPNRDLLGGFLREWKNDGSLLPKYIERKKTQIGEGFDTIVALESGKIKPSEAARKL